MRWHGSRKSPLLRASSTTLAHSSTSTAARWSRRASPIWPTRTARTEKLETLDGPPREIIRNNENVTCYVPDNKTVIIEKRTARQFPALLPEQLTGITDNYVVTKGGQDRVAGYDCQVIALEPKDNLRYGHKYCAELASGLALRSRTLQ